VRQVGEVADVRNLGWEPIPLGVMLTILIEAADRGWMRVSCCPIADYGFPTRRASLNPLINATSSHDIG